MKPALITIAVLVVAAVTAYVLNFVGVYAISSSDGRALAAQISESLSSKANTKVRVTCPAKIPEKKGGIEDCEASAGNGTTLIRVTQEDSRGHLHWVVNDPSVLFSDDDDSTSSTPTRQTEPNESVSEGKAGLNGPNTVVWDCRGVLAQPPSIVFTCADAGISAEDLSWDSFGGPVARGRGVLRVNSCQPSCAAGNYRAYSIGITLTDPVEGAAGTVYTVAHVTYGGSRPPGENMDTFQLGGPGE